MKYSIITVCKNCENTIKGTIDSIVKQTYNNYEYIIVDGKSNDNTLLIINDYIKAGFNIKLISELDDGIYDAMNKGIDKAEGDYCIFINSGDYLCSNETLNSINRNIDEKYDILYGNNILIINNKEYKIKAIEDDKLDFFKGMNFCHQSSIIKTKVLKEFKYSTEFKIAGDYDFFTKCYFSRKAFKYFNEYISKFACDGISFTNYSKSYFENKKIKENYFSNYKSNKVKDFFISNFPYIANNIYIYIRKYFLYKRIDKID